MMISFQRQKGIIIVFVTLGLIALMGIAALAIDLSHADINKTRLQNLTDSLALSAAISLNQGTTDTVAENNAKTKTLPAILAASGNTELNTYLSSANFKIQFTNSTGYQSGTAGAWVNQSGLKTNKFVRVSMQTPLTLSTWFANVLGYTTIDVATSSVAGPTPIIPCDNVLPVVACAANNNVDIDCSDGACFGYQTNTLFCFKNNSQGNGCPAIPNNYQGNGNSFSGNFGWMDTGSGGKDLKDCLAGDLTCVANFCANIASNATLLSEPGNVASADQGLNTRFNIFKSGYDDFTLYPPDVIVGGIQNVSTPDANASRSDIAPFPSVQAIAETGLTHSNLYKNHYTIATPDTPTNHNPQKNRRVVAIPFIDCTQASKSGGKISFPATALRGFGCGFLTQPMPSGGNANLIYAEIIEGPCLASGIETQKFNTGLYKVILYKDPLGGHS
jgi:Flp pilus assembly protein TadG